MKHLNTRHRVVAVAASGAMVLSALGGAAAQARTTGTAQHSVSSHTPSKSAGVVAHSMTGTARTMSSGGRTAAQYRKQVAKYWTPARMKHAKPADNAFSRKKLASVTKAAKKALAHTASTKSAPKVRPMAKVSHHKGHKPKVHVSKKTKMTPTAGKVFFRRKGKDYVCSGSTIPSKYNNVVLTAGHCVYMSKHWDTKFYYVPYYHNGKAPFGGYSGKTLYTTSQWYKHNNKLSYAFQYDIGMVTTRIWKGHHVGTRTGWNGIMFSAATTHNIWDFGYPAESPYHGKKMHLEHRRAHRWGKRYALIIKSKWTGGCSGGPWLYLYKKHRRWGYAYGVNSIGPSHGTGWLATPYFGAWAKKLWKHVHKKH